jgi:hypothetical protein
VADYSADIATAQEMIAEYGADAVWQKTTVSSNVNQPWKATGQQTTEHNVKLLFCSKGSGTLNALIHLIKGTDVPAGAPIALLASVAFEPEITDVVVVGDKKYKIASIDPVAPGGVPILYRIRFA